MNLRIGTMLTVLLLGTVVEATSISITTKYGDTGGIVGPLNNTTDKVNGREICPNNPTAGCDFDADPKFNNNNTVDDSSDDSYNGDLLVRTNDAFQAVAAWNWNDGTDDVVTITGTLPLKNGNAYYEWTELPGSCDPVDSSISVDKQTVVCVRRGFDSAKTGTKAEDLTFNVRVLGGTPSGTQPGDITFKVEADGAISKTDTTDGNSLTVTAAPRWNLQKSMYTTYAGKEYDIDGDGNMEKGWILDYKFYIESDEVSGETDSVNPIVGNESMGKDATFTFTDDMSGLPPHAKMVGCGFTGAYDRPNQTNDGDGGDGYDGSADPLSFNGAGSIYGDSYPERHIPQPKNEQTLTCTQSGNSIAIKAEHIDATLNHYPTKSYAGNDLPVNRAIAAMGNIYIFIPLDDVKNGENGIFDDCDKSDSSCDDGEFRTHNVLKGFDPTTPTGHSNFGDDTESENDNSYDRTLYYAAGSWSKRFRGGGNTNYNGNDGLDYVYGWTGSGDRSGDGMVTKGAEFSTWIVTSNTGGTPFSEDTTCDVIDAYRLKIQPIKDNKVYTNIGNRYTGGVDLPYRYYIWNDDSNYTDGVTHGGLNPDNIPIPYIVEYATTYVDDSFLPSKGGDTTVEHRVDIERECTDDSVIWTTDFEEAMSGPIGITKVRTRLKPGVAVPSGSGMYFWINHKIREIDLATNQPMQSKDLIINYAGHKFNYGNWYWSDYKPGIFPGNPSGWNGDRVIYTGPKVRIKKHESRTAAAPGDEVTYTLEMSYTNDTGLYEIGQVNISDVLPKDLKYQTGSVSPMDIFGEPTIGTCNDVLDINVTPCVEGENQVLLWDLGEREVNAPQIEDLNYTVLIGAAANVGVNTNVVKIISPTDASPISQRKADIGLTINVPASINIVKSTEENSDYPSKRERTTEEKDIFFLMDMRNGKDGDITDLDVIDILPFKGDGEKVIHFNDISVSRNVATSYHGSIVFHEASFAQHPSSSSECDYEGKIQYYYTNNDPKSINIAPTVGDENDVSNAASIWCEGDENGPNGCNGLSNKDVTAMRVRGARMEKQAICQFRVKLTVKDNLAGDNYSNSAGASATGVTLPVLSNALAVPVVGSSLGDTLWYDRDNNGIQDANENGIGGVKVRLLDANGNPVKDPANPTEDYVVTTDSNGKYSFNKLNHGLYKVKFDEVAGYIVSDKMVGSNSAVDSDIDVSTWTTGTISLGVDEKNPTIDAGIHTPIISGNIFQDGNGDLDVNGLPIIAPDGIAIYATLLDENKTVLASTIISNGTYSFDGEDGVRADSNYSVILATTKSATIATLPLKWNNTGENLNASSTGKDSSADGKISVVVGKVDVPKVDFGINKKPVATDISVNVQLNMGDNSSSSVPNLIISDSEDGVPTTVTITQLPTNGILYYKGNIVTVNTVIENVDPSQFTVDPDDGDVTVIFKYTTTDRAGVVSDAATLTLPFIGVEISGNVYNDGSNDANVTGVKFNDPNGITLYATLLDENNVVLASTEILGDGTYSFDSMDGVKPNTTYTVLLSTEANATTAELPENWNNTGENLNNNGSGDDNNTNGTIEVTTSGLDVNTTEVPLVDFGINKKPEAFDQVEPTQPNPGKENQVVVPDLNVTDLEDGTPSTITITTIPTNGKLYYDGVEVGTGKVLINFDPSKFTVDPDNGDQTLEFKYTATDKAGVVSDEATVTLPFTDIIISGKLFNDGNANGNVDGDLISKADNTQLYATLLDINGEVVDSKPFAVDGTYFFSNADGVTPSTNYTIVLSLDENATEAKLPENWNNADGENIGLIGLDGDANGIVDVPVNLIDIPEINFGINKKPVASDETEPLQLNPGTNVKVDVPDLNLTDLEDSIPMLVTIKTLPLNGTLYYDGLVVTLDQNITNFDNSLLTYDPENGDQNMSFEYTTTDTVGVESDPATVTMSFKGVNISGNVFDDGDGDENVNGVDIDKADATPLYVTLLDNAGEVLASKLLDANGSYSFNGTDGVLHGKDYSVVLSTQKDAVTTKLPENWNNTGENLNNSGAGNDDNVSGSIAVSTTGLTVDTTVVPLVDFGINRKPEAFDVNKTVVLNPGGALQVTVPDLNVSDKEDVVPTTVTIETLPNNAKVYYDGVEVTTVKEIKNFDQSKLMVDPENGDQNVNFTYSTTDRAGVKSDPATIIMPFMGVTISGTLFDDGNGDGNVNGIAISEANGTALFVTLMDANGTVLATQLLDENGTYSFDGHNGIVSDHNYSIVLSTEANGTTPSLPDFWNNTGENINSLSTGDDHNVSGTIEVTTIGLDVNRTEVPLVDFGINKAPTAASFVLEEILNRGKDIQVPLFPAFDSNLIASPIADREDGKPTTVTIKKLPTNGQLFYDGQPVVAGVPIENLDMSKFTVDPNDGPVTMVLEYTTTDRAGVESNVASITIPFTEVKVLGTVYNDGNANGNVDGQAISAPSAVQLYATLLNENGDVVASHPLNADGTYEFNGVDGVIPNSDYRVVISQDNRAKASKLPENWNNDGEMIGLVGTDGANDGMLSVRVEENDVPLVNFAINKKPVAGDETEPLQLNPGTGVKVDVPDLNITDLEDNTTKLVTIKTLPINGTLYYDGVVVVKDQNFTDFNNSLLTIDPVNGDTTVSFTYTTTDGTGVESDVATVDMSFDGIEISGNIFSDGNADETVNGTKISRVNATQLFATLVDANGTVMATMPIDANGHYEFTGNNGIVPDHNYSIVLSTEANATTPSLPANWNNTDGEHIGTDKGLDGASDGVIAVEVKKENIEEINFGINERPVTENAERAVVPNPGGDDKVQVLDLVSSDNNAVISVTIKTLPSDGVLYYDGVEVVAGQVIPNFDNKLLMVDPKNGNQTIEFEYTATDATGWESEPSTVKMPFSHVPAKSDFTVTDDSVPANFSGPATVISVLGNDTVGNGSTIHILDGNNSEILWQEGTAVGGASVTGTQSYKVPGEGTWTVEGGNIVFTAEPEFKGVPTPIYYVVEDRQGNFSNVAQAEINSCCQPYSESLSDSVDALDSFSMLLLMMLTSALSLLFFRRELKL